MGISNSVLFVSIGSVAVAAAGGIAWKTLGAGGPRAIVVEAQKAAAQLELSRLRSLMSSVAQKRFESQMFDSLSDARFKKSFAKFVGESTEVVNQWDAWQMFAAMIKHRERLTVAGMDIVKLLDVVQAVFGAAEVGKEAVDGDRASVPVKLVMPTETKSGFVDLIREGGEWKLYYLRWDGEPPLWEPNEDPPVVRQRKSEARTEAKTVLKEIASQQRDFEEHSGHYARDFKELGYAPDPGNRYTYFLANTGIVFRRDSAAERPADDDPVAAVKYAFGKNAIAALAMGTTIIGYDRERFTGQVDLKAFTDTHCPLSLTMDSGEDAPGPGVHRVGKSNVFIVVAVAKLDNGSAFDCWSIAPFERKTQGGAWISASQPFNEVEGEPYVAPAAPAVAQPTQEAMRVVRAVREIRGSAPVAPASLTEGKPTVSGSLDRGEVWNSIRQQAGSLSGCVGGDGTMAKIVIRFVVATDGTVAQASVVSTTTTTDAEMPGCFAATVKRWRFPEPKGGEAVTVTYPFVFSQKAFGTRPGTATSSNAGKVTLTGVEIENPEVDRDGLAGQITQHAVGRVDDCYEVALASERSLKGKLVLRFTINASGKLTDVEVEENSTSNAGLTACARRAMTGVRIKTGASGETPVAAAFVLTPN